MKEKIVLIGAGSAMFARGLIADLICQKWEADLALVDVDPVALTIVENLARKMVAARKAPLAIRTSVDRREALRGATVVIVTIAVGGRRAWEQDVFIPRKYGIYQPVGDSVMPGGTSRALRMVPVMVDIARDVLDLAPNALFFNYANPMTVNCHAVHKATGAGMIGLCHGVFHTARILARELKARMEELKYTAMGMNHMTWFTELRVKGRDVMPQLLKIAGQKTCQRLRRERLGRKFTEAGSNGDHDPFPFSWELCRLFGGFPAVMDRHVTEFFPAMFCGKGRYYGKTLGVDAYSFEDCIACGDGIFAKMEEEALSKQPLGAEHFERLDGEHEQVLDIITSIRKDVGGIFSVNIPNRGQIPNLPSDAIVECAAVADGGGLRAIQLPPLSSGMAGTLASRFLWVETVMNAALEGNRNQFIQSLILDGATDSISTAVRLADEMLQAQAAHLPQFAKA